MAGDRLLNRAGFHHAVRLAHDMEPGLVFITFRRFAKLPNHEEESGKEYAEDDPNARDHGSCN